MRTTIEIPDDLFRQVKATAALRGQTLKELVTEALRERLARLSGQADGERGWRSVFGKAKPAAVWKVQATIDEELSGVDPEAWR